MVVLTKVIKIVLTKVTEIKNFSIASFNCTPVINLYLFLISVSFQLWKGKFPSVPIVMS